MANKVFMTDSSSSLSENFQMNEVSFVLTNDKVIKFCLLLLDIVLFFCSFAIVTIFRLGKFYPDQISPYFIIGFLLTFLFFYILDHYRVENIMSGLKGSGKVVVGVILSFIIFSTLSYLFGVPGKDFLGRGILLPALLVFCSYSISFRFYFGRVIKAYRAKYLKWLFVGSSTEFKNLKEEYKSDSLSGTYFFYDHDEKKGDLSSKFRTLKAEEDIVSTIRDKKWYGLIFSKSFLLEHPELVPHLVKVRLSGRFIFELNDFYEQYLSKVSVESINQDWVTISNGFEILNNPIRNKVKRICDIIFALTLLTITFPLMLFVGLLIKLEDLGPIFYIQQRAGLNDRPFQLIKFRSMKTSAESSGPQWAKVKDSRVTKIGHIIRLIRIDELPQVINVLKGEMSFIGPRPERPEFNSKLEKEIPFYNLRVLLKPGLTGWAQVQYPYGASQKDAFHKLQYDLYYLKNYSLSLDLSILIKTVKVVLFGKGR